MVITWLKLKRPLCLATVAMAGLATTNALSQDAPTIKLNVTGKTTWIDGQGVVRIRPTKSGTQYPVDVFVSANKGPFPIDKNRPPELRLTSVEAFVLDPDQSVSESKANPTELTTVSIPDTKENRAVKIIARATYDEYADKQATAKIPDKTRLKDSVRPVELMIDTTPPLPTQARIDSFPGGGGIITIQFADSDLDQTSINSTNITVEQIHNVATKTTVTQIDAPRYNESKQEVSLRFASLPPGQFAVTLSNISDRLDNKIATSKSVVLLAEVPAGRQQGDHIAYPDYLGIENKMRDKKPGERVETRVVRLYYNRDAHRVVQVINRNAKQLNRSGYDEAQQLAEQARSAANEKQDRRRQLERAAVQTAETFRKLDRERQEKTADLSKAEATADKHNQQIHEVREAASKVDTGNIAAAAATTTATEISIGNMIVAYQNRISARNTDLEREEKTLAAELDKSFQMQSQTIISDSRKNIAAIKADLTDIHEKLAQLKRLKNTEDRLSAVASSTNNLVSDLKTRLNTINGNIDSARLAAQQAQEEAQQAEAAEQRYTTEAFRREVMAGQADPDTYAAGEKTSIDPVTQVSMTVIGEGVIQLRGPIRGINKIRRMIHDIDSPVGQVKVGIHTVQVNGEHGDRMELVYERIDKHIAHSRFMANQSGQLFRRAVAEVATAVSTSVRRGQMIPRDIPVSPELDQGQIKYLVAFFGRDFINELSKMDSELLSSDNRLLSLHSMDTLSLAGAMNVVGLADNMVRELIMKRFQQLVQSELPQSEYEYYKALTHTRHADPILNEIAIRCKQDRLDAKDCKKLALNAARTYNYPNTKTFFGTNSQGQFSGTTGFADLDDNAVGALNPLQYATVRMAQSLKAQLVAELEYKQLLFEYSLLPKDETTDYQKIIDEKATAVRNASDAKQVMGRELSSTRHVLESSIQMVGVQIMRAVRNKKRDGASMTLYLNHVASILSNEQAVRELARSILPIIEAHVRRGEDLVDPPDELSALIVREAMALILSRASKSVRENYQANLDEIDNAFKGETTTAIKEQLEKLVPVVDRYIEAGDAMANADAVLAEANRAKKDAEKKGFQIRMLEQFIDEQEEKSVELLEAMRSHSSNIDNYLKRQAIAFEDDLQAQFYIPAFQDVRRASRYWDVNLGQIETTTILTNNRTLARVDPSATMEFDLPKRDILINEAMKGAKAVATEYGALMHDPTFLAATSLQSGQSATGLIDKNSPLQKVPGLPADGKPQFGTAFDRLIPDPAVYKFETGTGFQIRPVIQPDGHSIVYDFDYTYTTNVREPVKADEKHVGRVKRHYIHTDVQTSSFELREVSRYVVALKGSRTSKGVPLLEDIPLVGLAFRPLPSDESSLQMNVILASSTIYPTQYDLMGLRWSPYADQVDSEKLKQDKEVQRMRREDLREQLLNRIRADIDDNVGNGRMSPGPRVNPQEYQRDYQEEQQVNDYRRLPDYRSNVRTEPRLPVIPVPPQRADDSRVEEIGRIRPSIDRSANSLIQPMSYIERQSVSRDSVTGDRQQSAFTNSQSEQGTPQRQSGSAKPEFSFNPNDPRPATTARPSAPAAPQRVRAVNK